MTIPGPRTHTHSYTHESQAYSFWPQGKWYHHSSLGCWSGDWAPVPWEVQGGDSGPGLPWLLGPSLSWEL